jgi:2-polyprenyl-3-methyl-5-hydroxy-6-metoxy-1,4-benzoquinol methylase
MEELKLNEKLSPQAYWDNVLKEAKFPRINTRRSYHYCVTMDYIDKYVRSGNYKSFFEVGCGSSGWLPYFATTYNLKVSGIDYSDIGCQLARKNLELLNIHYGEIICRDIFEQDWTEGRKYDIIFSYGVVEHFDNPEEVIRIFSSILNPGGIIITLVPNLNGIMGRLSKYFVPDVYKMHKVINQTQLRDYHEKNELINLRTGYAGTFTMAVIPLIRSTRRILHEGSVFRNVTLFLLNSFDKLATKLFRLFRINIPSRCFSPYIISITRSKE